MKVDNSLWQELLSLKSNKSSKNILGWSYNGESFSEILSLKNITGKFEAILLKSDRKHLNFDNAINFKLVEIPFEELSFFVNPNISNELLTVLQNYWPLSVLNHINLNLPHVFIHSATSLDGYLATNSGHSQWIGNDENLIHAHRLRALLDAVLIGGNTVLKDKPSLNVRHVKGENPKRLILSNRCENLSSLKKVSNCKTYLLRDSKYNYDDCSNDFDKIISFNGSSKKEKILDLLQKCKADNIASILIEGGGTTLSSFIETKFAKTVQFHISPLLFGSGIKAVKLPAVEKVDETHKLKNMYVTQIGSSFMITAGLV